MTPLETLRSRHLWPDQKPTAPAGFEPVWIDGDSVSTIQNVAKPDTKVVLELGSWKGLSALLMLKMWPGCQVICVDTWLGSEEHRHDPKLAADISTLYETFLVNCWDFRDFVTPIRTDTVNGMREVFECGVQPDLVYIDAAHDKTSVIQDAVLAATFFPKAVIVGDDWSWESVREGLRHILEAHDWGYGFNINTWWFGKNAR
jgi:predicted nicotinamide N-methyase